MNLRVLFVFVAGAGAASTSLAQSNSEVARKLIEKQSDAVTACSLLSNDEVVKVTGRKSYVKPEGVQLKGDGSSCNWDSGVNINMFSGPQSAQNMDHLMKSFKVDKAPRQSVSGIGDSAYLTHMLLGEYQGDHAMLVVRNGAHTVSISLEAKKPQTPQSVESKLMAVAKAALAKLP
jgi:hypothetical protein